MVRGPYVLWELRSASYLQLADTNGSIVADRTNIGAKTAAFVRSGDAAAGHYLTVTFAGKTATQPTVNPEPKTESSPGSVASSHVALSDGSVSATVVAKRQSVLVLKASFDPGWQATIDGRPVATQMVAPAYVGVLVSKGRHSVTLTYRNTSAELTLITIGIATLFALSLLTIYRRQRLRRARRGGPMPITDLPHGPDLSGAMNNPTADPK